MWWWLTLGDGAGLHWFAHGADEVNTPESRYAGKPPPPSLVPLLRNNTNQ